VVWTFLATFGFPAPGLRSDALTLPGVPRLGLMSPELTPPEFAPPRAGPLFGIRGFACGVRDPVGVASTGSDPTAAGAVTAGTIATGSALLTTGQHFLSGARTRPAGQGGNGGVSNSFWNSLKKPPVDGLPCPVSALLAPVIISSGIAKTPTRAASAQPGIAKRRYPFAAASPRGLPLNSSSCCAKSASGSAAGAIAVSGG